MTAKVLQADRPFLGKVRKVGEVLTDEELSGFTQTTLAALVSQGVLEMEGFADGAAAGLSVADREKIDRLQASLDRVNELVTKLAEAVGKLGKRMAKDA